MSDVVQWLNEIQDLQQKLEVARTSEAAAIASADNWRKRYETEAIQRRNDTDAMRQLIQELRATIESLQSDAEKPSMATPVERATIAGQIDQLSSDEMKTQLLQVWTERDRLTELSEQLAADLKTEQEDHAQTRKNLTTALGDTVDMLTKLQGNS
jgi:hypothetical protein